VNARRGRIAACEALLRWDRPGHGYVGPDVFIPIAEEIGLIVELGEAVLHIACAQACTWPEDVRVAVNVSAIQFRRGAIVSSIKRALAATGLAPDRLEVEITESVLIQDQDVAFTILEDLRRIGVRISLDDFGTNYSSLSYLKRFPFQKVKIDRVFLSDIDTNEKSQILLRGISRLCTSLGMSVVVEGVEEQRQMDFLAQDSEIEEMQGYLFGKPAPADHTAELLKAFSHTSRHGVTSQKVA
jgi:EAL domain-containing protein (putative c-di-GMP-specific phosphodiesterase class I)